MTESNEEARRKWQRHLLCLLRQSAARIRANQRSSAVKTFFTKVAFSGFCWEIVKKIAVVANAGVFFRARNYKASENSSGEDARSNLFRSFPGERMPPAQAGKLFIVAVSGNPFAAGLNGQGGKPDIGNQIARGRKGLALL
jgi:hypothetical protein